mmetsp:Transcript_3776/g.8211  ORF Transcript_3776/g.8211 Transcript_3776/m.8211 type:complete len:275 (-) Transcript_3776:443-1267(-)
MTPTDRSAPASQLTQLLLASPTGYSPNEHPSSKLGGSEGIALYHVLLVEDDAMQQFVMEQMFDAANSRCASVSYVVRTAGSTDQAMRMLTDAASSMEPFDLVLLDIELPDGNGDVMLADIRRLLGESVAIVMVSCWAHPTLVQTCMAAGADGYLQKPVKLENITLIWQHCCKRLRPAHQPALEARRISVETSSAPIPIKRSPETSPPLSPLIASPCSPPPEDGVLIPRRQVCELASYVHLQKPQPFRATLERQLEQVAEVAEETCGYRIRPGAL